MLLMAAVFGWLSATQSIEKYKTLWRQSELRYENRVSLLESTVKDIYKDKAPRQANLSEQKRLLSRSNFAGVNLSGIEFHTTAPACQGSSFDHADISGSVIMAGGSSFQSVSFQNANLQSATLSGGAASFQYANFAGADLSGATLSSNGASFQASSFRNAKLIGARVVCGQHDFQVNDINGADFSDADLSSIGADSLKGCYFSDPPKFNAGTKLPNGFDAQNEGWLRTNSKDSP